MKSSDIFKNVRGKESQKVGLPESSNYFTNQYTLTRRFTLESNRVFKTKAHMLAYIEDRINSDGTISDTVTVDTIKSALPGLILTVINDDENPDNNGMYYIENSDPNNTPGLSANKINITGPIPNSQIDLLFTSEEQGQTGSTEGGTTEGGTTEGTEGDDSGFIPLPPDPGMDK